MPFVAKVALSEPPSGAVADVDAMARSLAGWHSGRPLRRAQAGITLECHPDRFFEATAADSICTDPESGVVVVLDARIDNEAELIARVGGGERPAGRAELVLRAYLKYGPAFAEQILGDFAIAVWDSRARRLVLSVDRANLRPLYWRRHDGMVSIATEISSLLAEDFKPTLDEARMALWFVQPNDARLGHFYREIGQVPLGHTVVMDPAGTRSERYWFPEHAPDVRFRRSQDYVDACRELLTEAVRCRLPRSLAVGSHLSGGLDSPILVGIAAGLLAERGRRLTTFTAVHQAEWVAREWKGRYWNEGERAMAFARGFGNIDPVEVSFEGEGLMDGLDLYIRAVGLPPVTLTQLAGLSQVAKAARARRVGVMLNGFFGNGTVSHPGKERLHQLFRRGRWLTLARQWLGMYRRGYDPTYFVGWTFAPFLSGDAQRRLKGWLRKGVLDRIGLSPVSPRLLADDAWSERFAGLHDVNLALGGADRRAATAGLLCTNLYSHAAWYRLAFGMDLVAPYSDARVVRFCAGLPPDQFLGEGENRHLARRLLRAMGAPAELVDETRNGVQYASWHSQVAAALPEMRAELASLEHSPGARAVLDLDRLRHLVERDLPTTGLGRREVYADYTTTLPRGISVGRFIRRLEGGNG